MKELYKLLNSMGTCELLLSGCKTRQRGMKMWFPHNDEDPWLVEEAPTAC